LIVADRWGCRAPSESSPGHRLRVDSSPTPNAERVTVKGQLRARRRRATAIAKPFLDDQRTRDEANSRPRDSQPCRGRYTDPTRPYLYDSDLKSSPERIRQSCDLAVRKPKTRIQRIGSTIAFIEADLYGRSSRREKLLPWPLPCTARRSPTDVYTLCGAISLVYARRGQVREDCFVVAFLSQVERWDASSALKSLDT